MEQHRLTASDGGALVLDACFACQGLWFDPWENTRLAPAAVLGLFELLHQRRHEQHRPVGQRLDCPRCSAALERGYDLAQSGRYVAWRCPQRHGRFSTFGAFMVEKGFVRHLSQLEVEALAQRVGTIACTACGGSVDLRRDAACPWCRSALSLLDPQAVERALQRFGDAARHAQQRGASPDALADALIALERQRAREQREAQRQRLNGTDERFDLLAAGVELVWSWFRR
ncbi:Transcription factor zinc-finger [Oryzisolibacter propanilivorax]|uniref:Transcription factor zinc-finger n=2 Tax=Oryzisolibacter propanilivorax TaxID=1527607 RepID=A0A1G9Q2W5_9BURK|nr:Transcription factor zinc-finger [Oryzisolibacter propanilivorax]